MTNEQMKAGRFLRWHKARQKVAFIQQHLAAGRTVQITTATRAVRYKPAHVDCFKATKAGAYVQRGKSWDCIDFVADIRTI